MYTKNNKLNIVSLFLITIFSALSAVIYNPKQGCDPQVSVQKYFSQKVFHLKFLECSSFIIIPNFPKEVLLGNRRFKLNISGVTKQDMDDFLKTIIVDTCFHKWESHLCLNCMDFQMGSFERRIEDGEVVAVNSCSINPSLSLYLFADFDRRTIDGIYFAH